MAKKKEGERERTRKREEGSAIGPNDPSFTASCHCLSQFALRVSLPVSSSISRNPLVTTLSLVDKVASVALIKENPGANHYFIYSDTWKMHQLEGKKVIPLAMRVGPVILCEVREWELPKETNFFFPHSSSTLALQEINYSRDKFACGPVDFYLYTHS